MRKTCWFFSILAMLAVSFCLTTAAAAGDNEYTGKFDTELATDTESTTRIIFKNIPLERLKGQITFNADAHVSMARLYDPTRDSLAILALLVEEPAKLPMILIDLNNDKSFGDDEKFTFKESARYSNLYEIKVSVPMKGNNYNTFPTIIQYLKNTHTEKMTADDRLVKQSDAAFARGTVDLKGKKILVQYEYDFLNKQIDPLSGTQGIDTNGDGDIDMDSLSPEAAQVKGESAIFRIDNVYLSTKKADLQKNSIVLREHSAKDYKRVELLMGNVVPDFEFTDFRGKKHKFSEFRGKYVLLDIWGFWCPACKDELPYMKEAYNRFQSRNFEIVGLNTDEYTIESMRKSLDDNGMKWTQATRDSILPMIAGKMMIRSFPTTMLISPEGKIISRGRIEKDEPDLRGADLLETLDGILPQ